MSKFTFAFIALMASIGAALSQSCGQSNVQMRANRKYNVDDERIVGGVEARPNSMPWIVSMQQGRSHFCGGTLIRVDNNKQQSDIVVTAAHCVYDLYSTRDLNIVAGAHDLYAYKPKGQQSVQASKTIYHESYDPDSTINDIAIVVLSQPVNFTETVQPACLPKHGEEVPDNTDATVAGWGLTREGGYDTSSILMQVGVPTISPASCAASYKKANIKIDRYAMLCAGYSQGGKDACQGDSGGPFIVKNEKGYTLQGVVSFGVGCARPGMPGVYARVSEFISWINLQVIRNSKVKYM